MSLTWPSVGYADDLTSPEKDHAAQLDSLAELFRVHPEYRSGAKEVTLVLMGSSRNADDAARIEKLRALAAEMGIAACFYQTVPRVSLT